MSADERWADIDGFPDYMVNNMGRIVRVIGARRAPAGRTLKGWKNKQGYLLVSLYEKEVPTKFLISRLVAFAFIENQQNKPHVNHLDNDIKNNAASNLEWVTRHENMQHAAKQNRQHIKKKALLRIASDGVIKNYDSFASAAKDGFSAGHIHQCANSKRNTHRGFRWQYA